MAATNLKSFLTDIADAIREKDGTTAAISASNFKNRILSIPTTSQAGLTFTGCEKIDDDWKFNLFTSGVLTEDYDGTTAQAAISGTYTDVTLPHDWSIRNEFNSSSKSGSDGGALDGGAAWYKRTLNIEKKDTERYFLYFEGVYMESDVLVNGTHLKTHKHGYTNFIVEFTDVAVDGDNEILVFVKNMEPSSRWYSGSGIYRDVYFLKSGKVGLKQQSVVVTTPNLETEYSKGYCNTAVHYVLENQTSSDATVTLKATIKHYGEEVASKKMSVTVSANNSYDGEFNCIVANPQLWDEYDGQYYVLTLDVINSSGETVSTADTYYGYRWFKFDPDAGFYLNGKNIKLRGACMHSDLGCIGSEVNQSAIDRQLRSLKAAGFNAVRLTHNPSSPQMVNGCMRMGMMCIEEAFDCWTVAKKTYDYARFFLDYAEEDIKSMVKRSINNPAVIMWSLGNEIYDTRSAKSSSILQDPTTTVQNLMAWVKELDTTRPCTMGENSMYDSVAKTVGAYLDVQGLNYSLVSSYHKSNPTWKIYASESVSSLSSRGNYARDDSNYLCSSYDDDKVSWGAYHYAELNRLMNNNFYAGTFIWTGWDYIGEPTPFKYPARSSYFGIVDIAGLNKDAYYLYQSTWTTAPMCHIVPMNWSQWTVGDDVTIMVYSNAAYVKMYLNGTLIDTYTNKDLSDSTSRGSFYGTIPFAKGRLVANAYDANDNLVAQDVIYTPYAANQIGLSSDKLYYTNDDLLFVEIDINDKDGHLCPNANNTISASVTGGTIIGVDNGCQTSVEKYRSSEKPVFNGKAVCVIKPDSSSTAIKLTVSSTGLTDGTITINRGDSMVYTPEEAVSFIDATSTYTYVEDEVPCTAITVEPTTASLSDTTKTQQITTTVTPDNTTDTISYSSSDTSVAIVSTSGLVTAVNNGSATITATCGSQAATCEVTVSGISVDCTKLTLSDTSLTLTDTAQKDLLATIEPSDCTYEVSWSSSDSNVVQVVEGGHLTAVSNGTAVITATCGSQTATCDITVSLSTEKTLSSISATKTKTSYTVGDTYNADDITVTATYSDSSSAAVTNYTISPTTVDTSAAGETTLTISYTEGSVTKETTLTIKVAEASDWDVEWNGEATLPAGLSSSGTGFTMTLNESTGKYEIQNSGTFTSKVEASVTVDGASTSEYYPDGILEVEAYADEWNVGTTSSWAFGVEIPTAAAKRSCLVHLGGGYTIGTGTSSSSTITDVTLENGKSYTFKVVNDTLGTLGTSNRFHVFIDGVDVKTASYGSTSAQRPKAYTADSRIHITAIRWKAVTTA